MFPHSIIKTPAQVEKIKESAKINIAVLDYVAEHIRAGISTAEIDRWVNEVTTKMGGVPAPLGYQGFPKSVCTSINDEVCHGIPSEDIILKDGDIVNVDVSTILDGYYSDSSRMFCIGEVSEDKKRLVEVARQALQEGLKAVKPWGFLGDMGQAINDYVKSQGYSVVRDQYGQARHLHGRRKRLDDLRGRRSPLCAVGNPSAGDRGRLRNHQLLIHSE